MRKQIWISNPIRRQVSIRDKGLCQYCGEKAYKAKIDKWKIIKFYEKDGTPFEIDHRKPLSKGGETNIENLVLSCRKCNRSKAKDLNREIEQMNSILKEF